MALLDLSYLCFANATRVLPTSRVVYQLVQVTHSNLRSIAKKKLFQRVQNETFASVHF